MSETIIDVARAFNFTHADQSTQQFMVGQHLVPAHVAEHWFVKAHLVNAAAPPAPGLGSAEYRASLEQQVAAKQAELAALQAQLDLAMQAEQQTAQAMQRATVQTATAPVEAEAPAPAPAAAAADVDAAAMPRKRGVPV